MNLSLLSFFANPSNKLFRQDLASLNVVSTQIEQILEQNQLEQVQLFMSFQRFSAFRRVAERYRKLVPLCQKMTVFGVEDQPPPEMPKTQFVAVSESSELAHERFIIVYHPRWRVMLVGQVPEDTDFSSNEPQDYESLLTINPKAVEQSVMMVSVAASSTVQAMPTVDPVWQHRLTAQLAMQLAALAQRDNLDLAPVMQEIAPIYNLCQTVTRLEEDAVQLDQWLTLGQTLTKTAVSTCYLQEDSTLRPMASTEPLAQFAEIAVGQGVVGEAATQQALCIADADDMLVGYPALLAGSLPNADGTGVAGVVAFAAEPAGFFAEMKRHISAGVVLGGMTGLLAAQGDRLAQPVPVEPLPDEPAPQTAVIAPEMLQLPPAPTPPVAETSWVALQSQLTACLAAFDRHGAEKVWRKGCAQYPARELCLKLLLPVAEEAGASGAGRFATAFVNGKLSALFNHYPEPPEGATIITGCAQGEHQETAVLLLSLLLRWRGQRVIYVGADLPNAAIPDLLREAMPDMVYLAATQAATADWLAEGGELVAQAEEPTPLFGFGGSIFAAEPERCAAIAGIYVGDEFAAMVEQIEQLMTARWSQEQRQAA